MSSSQDAGNMAAIREALEMMSALFANGVICTSYANTPEEMEQIEELYRKALAALAAPPRNCAVATAKEQKWKEAFMSSSQDAGNAAEMREAILGNNAAIRKAMNVADETANELLSWCSNHYQELNCMGGRLKRALESAANAPWRNCDRFSGDIDKLREACARERGINPEEDFPEVFAEWLLAPLTERKGETDGSK